MPLHLFCLQEGLSTKHRLRHLTDLSWEGTNTNKTHATSHLKHWEIKLQTHNVPLDNCDDILPTALDKLYKTNLASFDGHIRHRMPTQLNVFTDGSQIDSKTGSGFIIFEHSREIISGHRKLSEGSTVFQAEIAAIDLACQAILQSPVSPRYVKIFVDSQAAIKALHANDTRSATVHRASQTLNKLAAVSTTTTLVWIPAHRGHWGNEDADRLAKLGASSTDPRQTLLVPTPTSFIKKQIKIGAYQEWTDEWRSRNVAQHTKGFYDGPSSNKAVGAYSLARLELGRLVRIITGHDNLNFFQTKIGLWGDPRCRFCGDDHETVNHLITSCPSFFHTSREHFPRRYPDPSKTWSIRRLLDFFYTPSINRAMEGTWAHGNPLNVSQAPSDGHRPGSSSSSSGSDTEL